MRTIVVAYIVSGVIFLFIFSFFCILFKSKLKRKSHASEDLRKKSRGRRKKNKTGHQVVHHRYLHQSSNRFHTYENSSPRPRQPYRSKTRQTTILDKHRLSGAIITRLTEDESLQLPIYDHHQHSLHNHFSKLSSTLEE